MIYRRPEKRHLVRKFFIDLAVALLALLTALVWGIISRSLR
jgi:hypothetical protein